MKILNNKIKILLVLFIFSSIQVQALDHIYTGYFSNKAVSGYDVISYFDEKKPLEGSSDYTLSYKGATWYFSSQANLDKFKANPRKYAPQYGGYCSLAMSNDEDAPGNPPFWSVYKEKLYLNYDQEVMDKWALNKDEFIKKADINWINKEKE